MANTLLHLLAQKCERHPDYARCTELFAQLDPSGPPRIELVHRANLPRHGTKKLGIFSGSFNPLTLAHTQVVENTVTGYQLDEMLLLLAKANVDKEVCGLPLAARLLTVKKYAENRQKLSVGISSHGRYIDKITALKTILPPETEIYFVVGYDTLVRIFDPKYYTDFHAELQALFVTARLIVANRAEADMETIEEFMARTEVLQYAPYVSPLLLSDVYAYMSSTEVRERLKRGKSIEHLVPSSILTMLDENFAESIRTE